MPIFQSRQLRLGKVSPLPKVTRLGNGEQECEPGLLVSEALNPPLL